VYRGEARVSDRKIRVLHVIDSDFVGGAQDLLWGLCKYSDKERFELDICFLQSHGEQYRGRYCAVANRVFSLFASKAGAVKLLFPPLGVRAGRYDIVHSHLFISFLWTSIWLPLIGKRAIHSINHTKDQVPAYYFPLYKQFARKNSVYFALNKTVQQNLIQRYVRPEKIVWQPIGIDVERFRETTGNVRDIRDKYGIGDTNRIILRVARLEKDKKHELFIRAMSDVIRKVPDAKLVIAGEGSLREELETLVNKLGLTNNVAFCGECRDDLPQLNRISKIAFALGWGSATTENMFCGLPIVSFAGVGAEEILIQGENGFIAPLNDIEAFALYAIDLLLNEEKRTAMGQKAKLRVQSDFTFEKNAKAYETFYDSSSKTCA
jgi:glycosyltransferase involved in cell wall biosynthesis